MWNFIQWYMTKSMLEREVRGIELNSVQFHLFKREILQIIWDMFTKRGFWTYSVEWWKGEHCSQSLGEEQTFEDCIDNQKNILGSIHQDTNR